MKIGALLIVLGLVGSACNSVQENSRPACDSFASLRLMSAAVPQAAYVPCVRSLPVGWRFGGMTIEDGEADFALRSEGGTISVDLKHRCDTSKMIRQTSDEPKARFYRSLQSNGKTQIGAYVFAGGCAKYILRSASRPPGSVIRLLKEGIALQRAPSKDRKDGDEL